MITLLYIGGIAVLFGLMTLGFLYWRVPLENFSDPLSELLDAQQGRKPRRDRHAFGEWD